MPLTLQAIALRVAAVSRVQCAEVTNSVGRRWCGVDLGGNGDLIARVPFPVVTAGRDAGSFGVVAPALG